MDGAGNFLVKKSAVAVDKYTNERCGMNQDAILQIERQVGKKRQLYQKLKDCFEKERQALIRVDIDTLWKISSEKETLCMEISQVKKELADAAASWCPPPFDLNRLYALLPRTGRQAFSRSVCQISLLKKEIDQLRQHNMAFMNESLEFMDQVMTLLSGTGGGSDGPAVYNRQCAFNSRKPVRFLRQEV
jgi:flagellar biosynthesis/type III secretory pathway chaperone